MGYLLAGKLYYTLQLPQLNAGKEEHILPQAGSAATSTTRFPGRTPALSRGNIRGIYPSEAGKDPGSRADFEISKTCNVSGRTWPGTRIETAES